MLSPANAASQTLQQKETPQLERDTGLKLEQHSIIAAPLHTMVNRREMQQKMKARSWSFRGATRTEEYPCGSRNYRYGRCFRH